MSVHESVGYMLRCDFPGCGFETHDISDEFSSWTDQGYAIEEWRDADGYHGPEGSFCRTHTVWVEDEDSDRDEIAPMPYSIDSLFLLAERRIAQRIGDMARLASYRIDRLCREWAKRDETAARREHLAFVRRGRDAGLSFDEIARLHEVASHAVRNSKPTILVRGYGS